MKRIFLGLLTVLALNSCDQFGQKEGLTKSLEKKSGVELNCMDSEIWLQKPADSLTIGKVKIRRVDIQDVGGPGSVRGMKDTALPLFSEHKEICATPTAGTYEVWSGRSGSSEWCYAYNQIDETLWIAYKEVKS